MRKRYCKQKRSIEMEEKEKEKKRKYGHRWMAETAFLTFKSILASVCIRNKVPKW
jgi:hypothetical protein